MTYQELHNRLCNGEKIYVSFTNVDDVNAGCDDGPDNGMLARLISICKDPHDPEALHLSFDFSGFEEQNKAVATHDWYDADGNAPLTWFETAHYPADGKWDTYLCGTMDSAVGLFELYCECNYCSGDEALYWEDECNNAFIDSNGEMMVAVNGVDITFCVDHCPKCGRVFKKH